MREKCSVPGTEPVEWIGHYRGAQCRVSAIHWFDARRLAASTLRAHELSLELTVERAGPEEKTE